MEIPSYLYAPESFLRASEEVVKQVANGCGTAGWKGKLVPDTILGLNITLICNIHDWMYAEGATQWYKDHADCIFLYNMQNEINNAPGVLNYLLRYHRRLRAHEYYLAVVAFGDDPFWDGKDKIHRKEKNHA